VCGHTFDSRSAIADRDNPQRCPSCGRDAGRRRLTACAVRGSQGGGRSGGCATCGGKNCSSCH
ncbi:MAG: FmdB family zinc ribbon protein, partial [Chloroflexota bacterium]